MPRVQWPRRRDGSGHRPKHALSGRSHQIRSQAAGPDAALYEQIDLGQGSAGHRGVLEIGAEGPGSEDDSIAESAVVASPRGIGRSIKLGRAPVAREAISTWWRSVH